MNALKILAILGASLSLSACGEGPQPVSRAPFHEAQALSSNASFHAFSANKDIKPVVAERGLLRDMQLHLIPMNVAQIDVTVPTTLRASEDNRYLPAADIVWREDPIGNRHEQVRAIFQNAFEQGTDPMTGAKAVSLHVQVLRFHSLTERARNSVGGVHSIRFDLSVRDMETGQLLGEPKIVDADLQGFGGAQARQAEARGETQKKRITDHLAEVIRQELTVAGGHVNARLGFIQALNRF